MSVRFIDVVNKNGILELSKMAERIWKYHYSPIIGKDAVNYMIKTYQSEDAISKQINDGFKYYFINFDNNNVGYTAYKAQKDNKKLFLSKLYLEEEFRGKGLSRKTLNFLVDKCKESNLESIHLFCNVNNLDSINAYKKLGFEIKDLLHVDVGCGYYMDDYMLEKQVL